MAHVELIEVKKRFGRNWVVHGIDLEIKDNEFIVLVGPSGCGKSTVLRMVAGLESVSGGEIKIAGKSINHVLPSDRNVAMVFQNYALYPHMSVYKNIAFSLKMAKKSKNEIDRKVREAADILELTPFLTRKPAALSGGQRQRVAMGRAIVRKPDVFLFDEPLSNLDAQLRTQMRMELRKLHLKMKTTTMYVTHDQIEAMTLADRIVILKDGNIQQVGSPIDVFEKPASTFVATFIGNPPTNILSGVIHKKNGEFFVKIENFMKIKNLVFPVPSKHDFEDGQDIIVGIRPDAIKADERILSFPESWRFSGEIIVAEIVGGQSLIEFVTSGINMIAEIEGRTLKNSGEFMDFGFDLNKMMFFDSTTKKAIYNGTS